MVMGVVTTDELDRMLTRLKLTAIRDQLDTLRAFGCMCGGK